ncbi:MAG: hypothetical protein RSF81_06770 [Oscillospiraceae bacterium]
MCSPNCPYFKVSDLTDVITDKYGVKHHHPKFVCMYNFSTITSWEKKCPKEYQREG